MNDFIELNPPERSRIYHFPDGYCYKFENVVRISVSDSGTHRLETQDGKKYIIPPVWYVIELDVDSWTF